MSKQLSWLSIFAGILSIITGFYLLVNPALSLLSFAFLFAIIFLVSGISEISKYITADKKRGWDLFNGIMTVLLAVWLFSGSFIEKVTFIPFIFAFWALFTGVSKMIMSFEVKNEDKKLGNTLLWTGILGLLAGLIMMGRPLMTGIFVTYTIAFVFIYQGIVSIIFYFKSKKG
ncbi:HdeD family acid-resistance protein [Streptococcus ratti]|uniref:Acid-resistance membrane protein n=1 Tax=Streptococcus ratti FA-1 = DSM 20564 TaxID=699248 RepID=A0ABN0GTJ3_STRRT|nr:DUF308 domain-containing protein [Streptococcus ratti]EJN93466.1 hypothetical protein SRA_02981 [Streptococcus ratti FA-1 = DSM 20564]EMP71787.1 hypothetical protein D822_00465 [Streptococcus ratti FA-1 = DSM 20564]QEY07343.1 hypothetical protein FY406_06710 [Streptococcus ratti]VEI59789.1 conserved hypothetical, predicted membrane protein (TMS5) [Streptococcus mutans]